MKSIKIGIELHKQLSNQKLFCGCKFTGLDDNLTLKTKFFSFPEGNIDPISSRSLKKKIKFNFLLDPKNACLFEFDEKIPSNLNFPQALYPIALENDLKFSNFLLFNRKLILDGSIPAGYQRTAEIFKPKIFKYEKKKFKTFFFLE